MEARERGGLLETETGDGDDELLVSSPLVFLPAPRLVRNRFFTAARALPCPLLCCAVVGGVRRAMFVSCAAMMRRRCA